MTGRPKRRRILEALETLAVEAFGEDMDDASEDAISRRPLAYVEEYIANGRSLAGLAADLTKRLDEPVGREQVSKIMNSIAPDAKTVLAEARHSMAHALAEEAQEIIDTAPTESREALQKAKMQSDVRLWRAERANPLELGGGGRGTVVNVTVQSLHLEALRARALSQIPRPAQHAEVGDDVVKAIAAPGG